MNPEESNIDSLLADKDINCPYQLDCGAVAGYVARSVQRLCRPLRARQIETERPTSFSFNNQK